ncbi:MAG: AAA-like domain-containing protein [Fimbriimonadaceae bacterium]|nr:AAA-like domain-containing protein [Fimbriimonadaceae bacterium]QYK58599.1 MAG: AAA-like domain-containing protein [Fimbriimonadaceae bacterium]
MPRLRSRSAASVLAFLALHRGREFSRAELGETIWPDGEPEKQMQNLRRTLSDIRDALESDGLEGVVLEAGRNYARLSPDHFTTDCERLTALAESAERTGDDQAQAQIWGEIMGLYQGPLLSPLYDSWITPFRLEFEESYVGAVRGLIGLLISAGQSRDAVKIGRRAVTVAPLREDTHVALIRAYASAGLGSEAVRQFEELERILDDNWGESPSHEAVEALESGPVAVPRRRPGPTTPTTKPSNDLVSPSDIVLLFDRTNELASKRVSELRDALGEAGLSAFFDRHTSPDLTWGKTIESKVRKAKVVAALVSEGSDQNEMMTAELEIADSESLDDGTPRIFSLKLDGAWPLAGVMGGVLNSRPSFDWPSEADVETAVGYIKDAHWREKAPLVAIEPDHPGGAVPLDSKFYIDRPTDHLVKRAIETCDSIVLVKAPRQTGKTSLLARAAQFARAGERRLVLSDFQTMSASQLHSEETLYKGLASGLATQLGSQVDLKELWNDWLGANSNLDAAVVAVLEETEGPVVWCFDEVDRLFGHPYSTDFFGLVRSWHNRRALEPGSVWQRLTVVITFATEAHLFIRDLNQSPFNVGTRLELADFDEAQMLDLVRRYGSPLTSDEDVARLRELVGGQPFLVRRALDRIATDRASLEDIEADALRDDGPFGDHLSRLWFSLSRDESTMTEVGNLLEGKPFQRPETFYRLRAGGLIVGSPDEPRFRCGAYGRYLAYRRGPN